jgi:zinc finger CCCH domain-containing protein 13
MQYGNEGYEYTKPSDLLRYDLDNDAGGPRQRRESFDRYHRPSVTLTTDYPRAYDSRPRGPPPSTRGFDKIYGLDERAPERRAVPPAAPLPPPLDPSRRSGQPDVPESPRRERRGSVTRARPVSLYQDPEPRSSHIQDDYNRNRREDLPSRNDPRSSDRTVFQDDNMAIRGLGIRDVRDADELRRDRRTEARPERDSRDLRRKVDDDLLPASRRDDRGDERRDERRDDRRDERRNDRRDEPREVRRSDRKDERRDDRREERRDERRSDLNVPETKTRSDDRRASRDIRNDYALEDRVDSRRKRDKERDGDDKDRDHKQPADAVAAVVGAAAAALGLKSVLDPDKKESDEVRHKPKRSQRDDVNGQRPRHSDSEESLSPDERPSHRRRSQRDEAEPREAPERQMPALVEPPPRDAGSVFSRKDPFAKAPAPVVTAAAAPTDSAAQESPPAEDGQTTPRIRRRGQSLGFKPTDTEELMSVREQLAALDVQDRDNDKGKAPVYGDDSDPPRPKAPADEVDRPSPPLVKEGALAASAAAATAAMAATSGSPDLGQDDDSRGRELAHIPQEEKQVRIVSPGRDKEEKKPIRGILKQPKAAFPEEANPIREGVAPHKDDKTKGNVPPGARWTKINRKLVNPEALTIGKERFEIRDDFVIVLRVLSKEEIDAYATATQQLRGGLHISLTCP